MYINEENGLTKNITNNTPTNSINDISSDISDFYTINLNSVSNDVINVDEIRIKINKDKSENVEENETVVKSSGILFKIIISLLIISPPIIAVLVYAFMCCI